ncbi:MAG: exodeoxyribonuclease V subunit gamma [Vibrionaceae bacterium]
MLKLYYSNQLEALREKIVTLIAQQPLSSPLQKECIVVPHNALAQWLKLAVARELGVAANIEFLSPEQFLWRLQSALLPHCGTRNFFTRDALRWIICQVLPALLPQPDFSALRDYLADDRSGKKLHQLAAKLAELFLRYLETRPAWIAAWEAGCAVQFDSHYDGDETLHHAQRWQMSLWQAICAQIATLSPELSHSGKLKAQLQQNLQAASSAALKRKLMMERVLIFAAPRLLTQEGPLLEALSRHVPLHCFHETPSHMLEKDAPILHSLLDSWGMRAKQDARVLQTLVAETAQDFIAPPRDSLLHCLQHDILQVSKDRALSGDATPKCVIAAGDRSLRVEVCHSRLREVEVLHDNLLGLFNANPHLSPRDIVVLAPNLSAYSALIQAVFANAPSEHFIPFTLCDRSAEQENPVLLTFLHLLELPNSRAGLHEMLEILQVPAVRRRFAILQEDLTQIQQWCEQTGVRWGLTAQSALSFDLPEQAQNSWQFGLSRMLLGFAMPSDAGLFNGMLPYDEVQGLSADLAGKLADFVDTALWAQQLLSRAHQGQAWPALLSELFDKFFALEGDEQTVGTIVQTQLASWQSLLADCQFEREASFAVVREWLAQKLGQPNELANFFSGAVTFGQLTSQRALPYAVICLLGMNDGDFPKVTNSVGFDLLSFDPQATDLRAQAEDRHLFLQQLLAARDCLYISFVGRSVQDNSEQSASILLAELLEYCEQNYSVAGCEIKSALHDQLIVHHPQKPFSPAAFCAQNPTSFAKQWLSLAKGECVAAAPFVPSEPLALMLDASQPLQLSQLQRFWSLPVKYFFNQRLNIYFQRDNDPLAESEPFELDALELFYLRAPLLEHLIEHGNDADLLEQFWQKCKASGELPVGEFAACLFDEEKRKVLDLYEVMQPFLQDPTEGQNINLSLPTRYGQVQLQGALNGFYQQQLILYRAGKLRPKQRVAAWLSHLCLCAMGRQHSTQYFALDGLQSYEPIAPPQALQQLIQFVETYLAGLMSPSPLHLDIAWAALEAICSGEGVCVLDEESVQKAQQQMQTVFDDSSNQSSVGENPYVARVWRDASEAFFAENLTLAKTLLCHIPFKNKKK